MMLLQKTQPRRNNNDDSKDKNDFLHVAIAMDATYNKGGMTMTTQERAEWFASKKCECQKCRFCNDYEGMTCDKFNKYVALYKEIANAEQKHLEDNLRDAVVFTKSGMLEHDMQVEKRGIDKAWKIMTAIVIPSNIE